MTKDLMNGMLGLIVGDAVGVPAEFKSRDSLRAKPVTDMTEYGTHHQPRGSWSDDSSMALCTVDSLAAGYDPEDLMRRFCDWYFTGAYTPWGETFDAGGIVGSALRAFRAGLPAALCGGTGDRDNGNGSLMRILPVVLWQGARTGYGEGEDRAEVLRPVHEISALTHAHPVSQVGCGIYAHLVWAIQRGLAAGRSGVADMLQEGVDRAWSDYSAADARPAGAAEALRRYLRLRDIRAFAALEEDSIRSGGYVVDTLEAAVWCLLNTADYRACVLRAVNLGADTDTVAAVAGSLAGLVYGEEGIPSEWVDSLARIEWIRERLTLLADAMKG